MSIHKPQSLYDLRKKEALYGGKQDTRCVMPTEEEIRDKCLEIQRSWSEETKCSRMVTGGEKAVFITKIGSEYLYSRYRKEEQ